MISRVRLESGINSGLSKIEAQAHIEEMKDFALFSPGKLSEKMAQKRACSMENVFFM
jgi:hypothetical protein